MRLPDLSDSDLVDGLTRCWETTAETEVPQYPRRRMRSAAHLGRCRRRRVWGGTRNGCPDFGTCYTKNLMLGGWATTNLDKGSEISHKANHTGGGHTFLKQFAIVNQRGQHQEKP